MVMPLCATFKYFVIVPNDPHNDTFPWPVRMDESIPALGDSLFTSRLVGYSPHFNRSNHRAKLDTADIRTTRLTLVAQDKENASVPETAFLIASGLFLSLQQGDVLHMAGTDCGGRGFSAIRDGRLIFAVGAVSAVPMGDGISVRFPSMIQSGQIYFNNPKCDPELRKQPIEVTVRSETFTAYEGRSQLGEYEVSVLHGFKLGFPGDDECVAMLHNGVCPLEEAEISARLLDR